MKKIIIPTLVKSSIVYTFFGLLSTAIPFLLLPILTKYLNPSEYMIVDLFTNFFQILSVVIGFSVFSSVERFYVDKETKNISSFISTIIIFSVTSGLLFIIASPLIKQLIYILLDIKVSLAFVFVLILYTIFFQITEIKFSILIMQKKSFSFGFYRIIKTLIDIGLSLLLIVVFDMTWEGRIIGQVVAISFLVILMFYKLRKEFSLSFMFNIDYLKNAIYYSYPISIHLISALVLGYIDRFFIIKMINIEEAGIYTVAYQIGLVISLIQSSFTKAWTPFFFEQLENRFSGYKERLVKITYLYSIFLILIVLILNASIDMIFDVFISPEYAKGKIYVFWIALGYAFNGIYKLMAGYFFFLKKTKILAIVSVGLGVINLILNYFFVKAFGAIGAAQATCFAFFLQFIIVALFANLHYRMPWFSFMSKKE